jgi:hypothetical protein
MDRNGSGKRWFPALLDLKIIKIAVFFTQKYLIRYASKAFFEEQMNDKIFYFLR